ncbi:hypothetical protein bas33_0164 [Escherichia phage HildyBeyeler]|uniref:Uncharacterized protein n=1 Tax=Escherichia phage HildyBeyeler TaxID=2852005 RepID=A0AAE7VT08_9CAUD|nr:hypothetical protein bas33_0164 [Escherichia phage HildyBeyeler]
MEIIVIILAVMLFIVTFVSFAIMRRARELAEDITKLRGELAALKLQREALKLFVVQVAWSIQQKTSSRISNITW